MMLKEDYVALRLMHGLLSCFANLLLQVTQPSEHRSAGATTWWLLAAACPVST
jgi:hypothetical protein